MRDPDARSAPNLFQLLDLESARVSCVFRSNVFTNEQLKPEPDRTSLFLALTLTGALARVCVYARGLRVRVGRYIDARFSDRKFRDDDATLCINLYDDHVELIPSKAEERNVGDKEGREEGGIYTCSRRATLSNMRVINYD